MGCAALRRICILGKQQSAFSLSKPYDAENSSRRPIWTTRSAELSSKTVSERAWRIHTRCLVWAGDVGLRKVIRLSFACKAIQVFLRHVARSAVLSVNLLKQQNKMSETKRRHAHPVVLIRAISRSGETFLHFPGRASRIGDTRLPIENSRRVGHTNNKNMKSSRQCLGIEDKLRWPSDKDRVEGQRVRMALSCPGESDNA
jgi:hypothetical protein